MNSSSAKVKSKAKRKKFRTCIVKRTIDVLINIYLFRLAYFLLIFMDFLPATPGHQTPFY
jgi:hypothetical protein